MSTKFNSEIYKSETKTSKLANSLCERKCSWIATWRQRRTHKLFKFEPSIARGRSVVAKRVLTGGPYKKRNGNPWLKNSVLHEMSLPFNEGCGSQKISKDQQLVLIQSVQWERNNFSLDLYYFNCFKTSFGSFGFKKESIVFPRSISPVHPHEIALFTYPIIESRFLYSPHPT